jgi:hypothetical protein
MADITLSIAESTFDLPAPSSSSTEITLALDLVDLENGSFSAYDNLTKYDKRICKCSFLLSSSDTEALAQFLYDDPQPVTLTLVTGCAFYPFGPDKGDEGVFTTSIVFNGTPKISDVPFRYFQVDLIIQNTGQYPSYSLPSQIDEGPFEFSGYYNSVTGLRMPEKMFNPDDDYRVSIAHTENSSPLYVYNGEFARFASTSFIQTCNMTKAAALLDYLTRIERGNDFSITSPTYFYPFGARSGDGQNWCQLSSNKITVDHESVDLFNIKLSLRKI